MVDAVNSLIFNTLISERAVNLPGIGTLYVDRIGATVSGDAIIAPRYSVTFSSHASATSIVDVIAREATIDTAVASDIFERWVAKTKSGNTLEISGVGTLKDKTFIVDNELLKSLNVTQFSGLKRVQKRSSAKKWIATLSFVIIVLAACAYLYFAGYITKPNISVSFEAEIVTTEIAEPTTTTSEPDIMDVVVEENNIAEDIAVIEEKGSDVPSVEHVAGGDWRAAKDIRHRVIVGSYSTPENAERAISDIARRTPELNCSIYTLGSMYAVAIYGSSENDDCVEFMRNYSKHFPQIWIHTPKRYR